MRDRERVLRTPGGLLFLTIVGLIVALKLTSCAPQVNLATPEPVKIDVNMKVEVTTKEEGKTGKVLDEGPNPDEQSPSQRRRLRMASIQDLKNNRIVGEGKEGFLVVRELPSDESWRDYALQLIKEENADRKLVFEDRARQSNKLSEAIARQFTETVRNAAFPGEWLEDDKGNWYQKK